jgi:hypothetical protein
MPDARALAAEVAPKLAGQARMNRDHARRKIGRC